MFRQFVHRERKSASGQFDFPDRALQLFRLHPLALTALLEHAWAQRENRRSSATPPGHPDHRSDVSPVPNGVLEPLLAALGIPLRGRGSDGVAWEHLIYAHMIENAGVYEIFRKVIHRYLHGNLEGLSVSPDAAEWLRTTEELFFRPAAPLSIGSVSSELRPDLRATRRNAYWRMFGMDLVHGEGGDGRPYAYEKSQVANSDFRDVWKRLLTEVWVGITNVANTSGSNSTDDATLVDLTTKLKEMLLARRRDGQLSREEFHAVSTMAWFHLTLEFDSPIVESLGAIGAGPVERLVQIAALVGEPVTEERKRRLDSFFDLADPMSRILLLIERGTFDVQAAVPALYVPGAVQNDMKEIIRAWSTATSDNIKGGYATTREAAVPARV